MWMRCGWDVDEMVMMVMRSFLKMVRWKETKKKRKRRKEKKKKRR